jgi:tRNA threonylcarbamoyl adenosine modification protein (Sua5/YciO/YrdC/YwlC family)
VIDAAVRAIRTGQLVILPTDTVYGLCTTAYTQEAADKLYSAKGRPPAQPTALLASDVDMLLECVPELRGRAARIARALLPGPFTLVLPNPARRYRWLTGTTPEKIGVRVAELPEDAASVLAQVGAVAATSANLAGGPEPSRLDDVPEELRRTAAAELDAGELSRVPSTVIDVTGDAAKVLREGAVPASEALERASAAVRRSTRPE